MPKVEDLGVQEQLQQLHGHYDRLVRAVEQTADTVMITNRQGVIEYVNPAFEETTDYAADEALGRTPSLLKSGLHDNQFYKELWALLTAVKPNADGRGLLRLHCAAGRESSFWRALSRQLNRVG
jgi:PAS domain S-box-containing protein